MGEAKRRREYERIHAAEIEADRALRSERFGLIERMAGEDALEPAEAVRMDARLVELNRLLD